MGEADAQGESSLESLNLLGVPQASAEQTPAEKAGAAAAARDSFISKASKGIHDIMSFTGNASVCETGTLKACNEARDKQMQALHQIREATKQDIQDSKKAGQKACKFARKSGVDEHVADHERDEAEREAERMEAQAEREAGKAAHRVDHVFAQART